MFDVAVLKAFDFLGPEYGGLYERATATAFQHPLWLHHFYATLVPSLGVDPMILTVRAKTDGRLVLVIPLLRRRRRGLAIVEYADLEVTDYAVPVVAPGEEKALLNEGLCCDAIRRQLAPFDLIRISKIRADSVSFGDVLGPMRRAPMDFSAHATRLVAPFEAWREQAMDGHFTRFLDRKRRKLKNKGELSFREVTDHGEVLAIFQTLRELRKQRFAELETEDVFQTPAYFDFYLAIAQEGQVCGLSRTSALCLDGKPIAMQLGLNHHGAFHCLLVGYDLAKYRNWSVGLLMMEDLAADCIARGQDTLDFTIGDEPYKTNFGTTPTAMMTAWSSAGLVGSLASMTMKHRSRARRIASKLSSVGGQFRTSQS